MPVAKAALSERQEKWFASIKENMARDTGKSLDAWIAIARTCPETAHKARLAWFKSEHGLLMNRASIVLDAAFGGLGWDQPDALIDALWADDLPRRIFEKIRVSALKIDGASMQARKGYTAFSCQFQFAAARPVKGGVRLGLALAPAHDGRLEQAKPKEGWSERLKSTVTLNRASDVDAGLKSLITAAAEKS